MAAVAVGFPATVVGALATPYVDGRVPVRLIEVAAVVGVCSGLLANSGGFLLAPLYLMVPHLPIERAPATSLAVSAGPALPGTVTHWLLEHINWQVVLPYTVLAVPAAYLRARPAVRADPAGWPGPTASSSSCSLWVFSSPVGDLGSEPRRRTAAQPLSRAQGPLIRAGRDFCRCGRGCWLNREHRKEQDHGPGWRTGREWAGRDGGRSFRGG
ncbi:sulfite exporter TauE/SafE family protein [Micromonospora marina]|uniref:sulfite exporter TauE/SafE family protein n=1 Tax=Micromonospora marina TaxID=307120 RepID=UPI003D758F96